MAVFDKPPRYRSYLLMFWEERSQDPAATAVWRFRLEDPRTGKRRGFADLEALMAVLERETTGSRADAKRRVEGVGDMQEEKPCGYGD